MGTNDSLRIALDSVELNQHTFLYFGKTVEVRCTKQW